MAAVSERELLTNRLQTLDSHRGLKRIATTPARLLVRAHIGLDLDGTNGLVLAVVVWTTVLVAEPPF